MTTLFRRVSDVVIGPLRVTGLRVQFQVERDLLPRPNRAEIRIYNLSKKHQAELEAFDARRQVPVRLEAGYQGAVSQLYHGDLRYVRWEREGPQVVAIVSSGDGLASFRSSRTSRSFAPGTPVADVLRFLAENLGVGLGNLDKALGGKLSGNLRVFTGGTVVSGQTADELRRLLDAVGLEHSIQDGALQVIPKGGALEGTAVKLSASTGLVGSPSINTPAGFGGSVFAPPREVTCSSKLHPDIVPGRLVQLESEFISGLFRTFRVEYRGDTHGADWHSNLVLRFAR